jgi:SAM-dependent methyltransferase
LSASPPLSSREAATQSQAYEATLAGQRAAWDQRPFLRALYREWFEAIVARLSSAPGPTVELGCGIGAFKEFAPTTVGTDVFPSPWTDEVVDATRLPYADGSVANLVMVDVLHHLRNPSACLAEAERVLRRGGRFVCLEPYCSPASTLAYKAFHHEDTDLSVDPFGDLQSSEDPFDSNQALPTLMFWRQRERLASAHPRLAIVERRRLAVLAYPLSGGFTKRPLVPRVLQPSSMRADRLLAPLARLAAFRCLVTLERV